MLRAHSVPIAMRGPPGAEHQPSLNALSEPLAKSGGEEREAPDFCAEPELVVVQSLQDGTFGEGGPGVWNNVWRLDNGWRSKVLTTPPPLSPSQDESSL